MNKLTIALVSLVTIILATPALAHNKHCIDGIDNDKDGGIDYLRELAPDNGEETQVGGGGDPIVVMNAVAQAIASKKLPLTPPQYPLRRSSSGSGGGFKWRDDGTLDAATLNQVCRVLGFSTPVASTCLDTERSSRYPAGKCNFHSPHNNSLSRFTGAGFTAISAEPKYGQTWLASITCRHRLSACSDGWDNDGDGLVDYPADPGCASANDDDERQHDSGCKGPTDPSEKEECRDGIDNDKDGKTDYPNDLGCSSLSDNDEANGSINSAIAPRQLSAIEVAGAGLARSGNATAAPSEGEQPDQARGLTPIVNCVQMLRPGGYVAYFGYRNDSGQTMRLAIGADNRMDGSVEDLGQPYSFINGEVSHVVRVPFNSSVSWSLAGRKATATATSRRCGDCQIQSCNPPSERGLNPGRIRELEDALAAQIQLSRKMIRLLEVGVARPSITALKTSRSVRAENDDLNRRIELAMAELRGIALGGCSGEGCLELNTTPIVDQIEAILARFSVINSSILRELESSTVGIRAEGLRVAEQADTMRGYIAALLASIPRRL